MKRLIPALLCCGLVLFLFAAASPPYVRTEIEITIDGAMAEGKMIRTDAMHARRAQEAGGYEKLYEELIRGYSARDALNYLGVGLGDYLWAECARRYLPPTDASLEWTGVIGGAFRYQEERPGRAVDLKEAGRQVARAMDDGGEARITTREVSPDLTLRELRRRTTERARFSTSFLTSGENRRHNIEIAARSLHGTRLESGETFSFNERVGERSAARAFRSANIVVNGDFVKGIGGGVCQVSTTLYNAVLLAGLRVDRAAAHSRPVSYVPYSQDCTVSSAIDFTFTNDTPYPVYLAAEIRGAKLTFLIYGEEERTRRSLESEVVEELPYRNLREDGTAADPLTDTLLTEGHAGIRSRLYLLSAEGDKRTRTLIRETTYPAKNAIYKKP